MKTSSKIFLGVFLAILIVSILNWSGIQRKWIEVFKLDKTIVEYNASGNMDGKAVQYVKGRIYFTVNLVNGVKEGWETMYYSNGKIKSKTFFVNGLPSGKGYLYTREGKVAYSGSYRYGKPYGTWYEYYHNGNIKKYLLYDLHKDVAFTLGYDSDGKLKLKEMSGLVVSPNFFSILPGQGVPILLDSADGVNKNREINDLFITVANPAHTRLSVTVKINGTLHKFPNVKGNTIKILNAFRESGKYDIFLKSYLYNEEDKIINGINIPYSIIK